jgi:KaiC/GvpD/RAD55 family RecA-like ATPase
MKILRGLLPDPRQGDDLKVMGANYISLRESIYRFDQQVDEKIYEFISDFYASHSHLPTLETATSYFEANNQFDEADRIKQIAAIKPDVRGDFRALIEREVEAGRTIRLADVMNTAKTIARQGLEVKDPRSKTTRIKRGVQDAGKFLLSELSDIISPTFGSQIGGEALGDEEGFWEEYERARDAVVEISPKSGLQVIDEALGGFHKKELYIVAGFTGHMKSKTALNWVYNQAIYQGSNTIYFSLEMHYNQCRRTIYAFHTMHPKFREKRMALGIQTQRNPDVGLDPTKIRQGQLSKDEELFLREVVKDLKDGVASGTYGSIQFEVADPDSLDFTVEDMRSRAEALVQQTPAKLLVVDHALLMSSRGKYQSTTERLNEVIRDLKKVAMGFNRGEGIPILCLFQINREGFKAAEKNNGNYNLTHLSYANEAERSADVVIASWFGDDVRANGTIKYQCLKSRDQAPFDAFEAQTAWPSGRILNLPVTFQMKGSTKDKKDPLSDALD